MPQPAPPPLPPLSDAVLERLAGIADAVNEDRATAEGVTLLCLTMPAIIAELRARRGYAARIRALADRMRAHRGRRTLPRPANVVSLTPPMPPRPALGLAGGWERPE